MPPPPAQHRTRRIEDALAQLVDSLLPRTTNGDDDNDPDSYADAAEADEIRHSRALRRAWRILDSSAGDESLNAAPTPLTGGSSGTAVPAEVVNNAPDSIKRKLLRENASPDKAVRFSNLYSRLLTQPVLGQKWAILYLLYRIGEDDSGGNAAEIGGRRPSVHRALGDSRSGKRDGRRSPLLDEHQLDRMLFKDRAGGRANLNDEIAPGSSISAAGWESPSAPSTVLNESASQKNGRNSSVPNSKERKSNAEDSDKESRSTITATRKRAGTHQKPETAAASEVHESQQKHESGPAAKKPTESLLLRDLPFNLQGLSSTNLVFSNPTLITLPPTLPVPIVSLLHTLAEPCLLYRGLSSFIEHGEGGLVIQSLRAAIGEELRSYLGLVATLEGEIRRALSETSESSTEASPVVKAGVTLKRCVVWMREPTMALRLMSLIVEEAKDKKGGQLISMIHGFSSSHGDPFVGAFAERLLAHVTRPFYGMLTQWIYDGELSDPYKEFFVVEPESRPSVDPRRTATSVWDDKYKLDDNMVPTITTQEFAKKVFLIGKSLNFIRYGCGDSTWVAAYSRDASKELRYGDTATLETSIDQAYKTTMARLIYLMDTKFKLFDHLKALKKYLLLGQGDFIALLMESLSSNLDRPANSQYRHTLTAQLEHAIRSSNAQYDSPDVLRRLDARMLELSHGEIGWDCFTLEYKIDAPVDVVITPWGSTQYLKVFNFLWRVKRVEFALGSTWRRFMTGARGVIGSVDDKLGKDWKRARCAVAEMIHFISQLQYYILFEVIESSWDQLQMAISKPDCTLDDLVEAHTKYLNAITHKGLLGSSSSRHLSSSSAIKEDSFLSQLHQILKVMLAYKDAVDGLYSFSVAEFTRRQEFSAKIETRTAQGQWGVTEKDMMHRGTRQSRSNSTRRPAHAGSISTSPSAETPFGAHGHLKTPSEPISLGTPLLGVSGGNGSGLASEDHLLPSIRSRLRNLSSEFRARVVTLLGDLAYQPDVDMRFLGVVMNFNDFYQVVRRRKGGTGSTREREREREKRKGGSGEAGSTGEKEKGEKTVAAN